MTAKTKNETPETTKPIAKPKRTRKPPPFGIKDPPSTPRKVHWPQEDRDKQVKTFCYHPEYISCGGMGYRPECLLTGNEKEKHLNHIAYHLWLYVIRTPERYKKEYRLVFEDREIVVEYWMWAVEVWEPRIYYYINRTYRGLSTFGMPGEIAENAANKRVDIDMPSLAPGMNCSVAIERKFSNARKRLEYSFLCYLSSFDDDDIDEEVYRYTIGGINQEKEKIKAEQEAKVMAQEILDEYTKVWATSPDVTRATKDLPTARLLADLIMDQDKYFTEFLLGAK